MLWELDYRLDLLFTLLLACVGIFAAWCGLSRRHWFWRFAAVLGIAWLLVPTEAYEAIIYFLLVVGQVTVVLGMVRVVHGRRSGPREEGTPRQFRFSLKELLLATSLTGAVMGLVALLAVQEMTDVARVAGSSVASAILILAACLVIATSSWRLVKAVVGAAAVAIATTIWHFSYWTDWHNLATASWFGPPEHLLAKNLLTAVLFIVIAGIAAFREKRPGGRRRWIVWPGRIITVLLVAATMPLGAYFYFRLSVYERPPVVHLPNPNGYDLLVRAGNALPMNIPQPETDPPNAFSQFAAKHGNVLEMARQGLVLPCRAPLSYTHEDLTINMDEGAAVRRLAKGFYAEAIAHAQAGDYPTAAASSVDAVRLSAEYPRGGLLVHVLIANALGYVGVKELKDIRRELDATACRSTTEELARIDRGCEAIDEFVRRDRIWGQCAEGWRGRLDLAWDDVLYDEDPMTKGLRRISNGHVALLRLLIAELTVRAYQLEHDTAPRSLDQLVPAYLAEVPLDPFSGGPLRYRADVPTPFVYSVGPDGDDDGGGKILNWVDVAACEDGDITLDFPEDEDDSSSPPNDTGEE